MKYRGTVVSFIIFLISTLSISLIINPEYWIVGVFVEVLYLSPFVGLSLYYEAKDCSNSYIPTIMLIVFYILWSIFLLIYFSVKGLVGVSEINNNFQSSQHACSFSQCVYVSFLFTLPQFIYILSFFSIHKLWKECIVGSIGYVLLCLLLSYYGVLVNIILIRRFGWDTDKYDLDASFPQMTYDTLDPENIFFGGG